MEKTKKILIKIHVDGKHCTTDCNYHRSPAQFVTRCFLFNYEELKNVEGFRCERCQRCLDEFK
jgi:hypothetical protein